MRHWSQGLPWRLPRPPERRPGHTVSRFQPSSSWLPAISVFFRISSAFAWVVAETVSVTTAENSLPGEATMSPEMFSTWIVCPAAMVPLNFWTRVAEGCSAFPTETETSINRRPSASRIQTARRSARAEGVSARPRCFESFIVFIVRERRAVDMRVTPSLSSLSCPVRRKLT